MNSLEFQYYKRYSKDRYNMTHLTHLTPFIKKQYFSGGARVNLEKETELNTILKQIIKNTLKINRFDILSRYQEHNHSPSTRNMHSCQLLFWVNSKVLFYDLYEDELFLVNDHIIGNNFSMDKIYIIGFSDLLNISRYYSEFALYLSILDAGHVLFNVKNTLNLLENKYGCYKSFNVTEVLKQLDIPLDSSYASFLVEMDRPNGELEIEVDSKQKRIATLKTFNELKPTAYVSQLLEHFKLKEIGSFIPMHYEIGFSYNKVRNSAHTMVGNFNISEQFDKLNTREAVLSIGRVKNCITNPEINFCIVEKEKITFDNGSNQNINVDFSKILYNDHEFFDLQTYSKVVVCYSNEKLIKKDGLIPTIISAGELMQAFCLHSAEKGYAFRPMKNHNDEYLKEILELDNTWEINYIGVLCNSPVTQIREYL
ncbi:hypothetical protein ACO11K_000006 [Bacillus cytotoxicus]|uniref:hypothetical protein n=1 Tax=Bacillus cereus group sp. BfR-BA-01492 TaxID=2920361 RepID=UPI001F58E765|nr:hypothetical protein [Bacillus cereus group sp. BfR-BA-01492]EMA6344736.1 hypothetical protein [Bacillus cytotoxicus]